MKKSAQAPTAKNLMSVFKMQSEAAKSLARVLKTADVDTAMQAANATDFVEAKGELYGII